MHEVRVYDSTGILKKVISKKKLDARSIVQLESPHLFLRNKRRAGRPPAKSPDPKE